MAPLRMLLVGWCAFVCVCSSMLQAELEAAPAPGGGPGVTVTNVGGKIRVEIGGSLFTEYDYRSASKPFLYPLVGPAGEEMTRNWPMREAPDEERDHPHHRSLWFTHGAVNGHDFWSEGPKAGRIVHEKFLRLESGVAGVIESQNRWVATNGTTVCTDVTTIRMSAADGVRLLDYEITLQALGEPLVFGDTKEGTFGIRLAETMRLKGKVGRGHIINSEGVRDGDTWGKRAKWCDYYGPVGGKTVGIAVFDHPENPRHPTWWHVRDYGLFAANPFGVHDFEKKPAGTGDHQVPAGGKVRFRYRVVIHEGDAEVAKIAERYAAYAGR